MDGWWIFNQPLLQGRKSSSATEFRQPLLRPFCKLRLELYAGPGHRDSGDLCSQKVGCYMVINHIYEVENNRKSPDCTVRLNGWTSGDFPLNNWDAHPSTERHKIKKETMLPNHGKLKKIGWFRLQDQTANNYICVVILNRFIYRKSYIYNYIYILACNY